MLKQVTTYYLEMLNPSDFKPKEGFKEKLEIRPISADTFQQWMLFVGVGLPWRWYSRLKWSPLDWENYLFNNDVRTFLVLNKKDLVGYFELLLRKNNELEITFLGLFQHFIGTGNGGYLLSHALDQAWNTGASKVWLHTCTTDHKTALSNYLARGFKIANQVDGEEDIPDKNDYLTFVNNFMSAYIDGNNSNWL